MTAGQLGAKRLDTPHHSARPSHRAVVVSTIVVLGLAIALAVPVLVANGGPRAAIAPAVAAPTVVVPAAAAPTVVVPAAAAPTVVAPAPALVLPSVFGPAIPNRVPTQRTWPGRSWGRYAY
jgi:hypothetical protein